MLEVTKNQVLSDLQNKLDMSESDISDLFKVSFDYFKELGYEVISFGKLSIGGNNSIYTDFALLKNNKTFIGEIKNYPPDTEERKVQYLNQLKHYMKKAGSEVGGGILVTPSFVSQDIKSFYQNHNIQVWDIDTINKFKEFTSSQIQQEQAQI